MLVLEDCKLIKESLRVEHIFTVLALLWKLINDLLMKLHLIDFGFT